MSKSLNTENNKLPFCVLDFVKPCFDKKNRFCIFVGGRGSGKSTQMAKHFIIKAYQSKRVIVCAREYHSSIKNSVHTLLKDLITDYQLNNYFQIKETEIVCPHTGSRFIFVGLHNNIGNIKSIPGITDFWIEEADTLSHKSWMIIKPGVRTEGSQIFITFNPTNATDCIYEEFLAKPPPEDAYVKFLNWEDNPYFSNTSNNERLRDLAAGDMGLYNHVWEGALLEHSDAQVFKNKFVSLEFEEDIEACKYYGMDFGFSDDPFAAVRCYIKDNCLYITHEVYQHKLELNHIGIVCEEAIPGFKKALVIADSSSPSIIAYLKNHHRYNVEGADKGKGSVEDGVSYLRSFDTIYIHKRCPNAYKEFVMYQYKTDKYSKQIMPGLVDAHNHIIDSLRYALERCMKNRKSTSYKGYSKIVEKSMSRYKTHQNWMQS